MLPRNVKDVQVKNLKGVSFTYDSALDSEVERELIPELPGRKAWGHRTGAL